MNKTSDNMAEKRARMWFLAPVFFTALVLVFGLILLSDIGTPPRNFIPHSVSISDGGRYIAVGANEYLFLFSRTSTSPLWELPTSTVFSISISGAGSYVEVASASGFSLHSSKDGATLWTYSVPMPEYARFVALFSDESHVAGASDYNIYLFSIQDNEPLWSFETDDKVTSLAISQDSEYIVVATSGGGLVFSRENGGLLWRFQEPMFFVDASSGGSWVIMASESKIYVFPQHENVPVRSWEIENITSISASENGDFIAVGSLKGFFLLSREDNSLLWSYSIHPPRVGSGRPIVSISADGRYVVAEYQGERGNTQLVFFSRDENTPLWKTEVIRVNDVPIGPRLAVSDNGSYIARAASQRFRLFGVNGDEIIRYDWGWLYRC
jgi:outer membrane protein assembly factor BamB